MMNIVIKNENNNNNKNMFYKLHGKYFILKFLAILL